MLVELAELPVNGEDVHVVVLLEVVGQQVQGVISSLEPLLVLVDLLHLKDQTDVWVQVLNMTVYTGNQRVCTQRGGSFKKQVYQNCDSSSGAFQ